MMHFILPSMISENLQPVSRQCKASGCACVSHRWALEQGATAGVTPAIFPTISPANRSDATPAAAIISSSSCTQSAPAEEAGAQVAGGLRGCAAAADMEAGCVVMSVPAKLLITYDTAAESDFGKALSRLPGEQAHESGDIT